MAWLATCLRNMNYMQNMEETDLTEFWKRNWLGFNMFFIMFITQKQNSTEINKRYTIRFVSSCILTLKSTYLSHFLMKIQTIKLILLLMEWSIRYIAQFHESRSSKTNLNRSAVMESWFSRLEICKQKLYNVPIDEWMMDRGLIVLEVAQTSTCH
jgi:hypothetical protein